MRCILLSIPFQPYPWPDLTLFCWCMPYVCFQQLVAVQIYPPGILKTDLTRPSTSLGYWDREWLRLSTWLCTCRSLGGYKWHRFGFRRGGTVTKSQSQSCWVVQDACLNQRSGVCFGRTDPATRRLQEMSLNRRVHIHLWAPLTV